MKTNRNMKYDNGKFEWYRTLFLIAFPAAVSLLALGTGRIHIPVKDIFTAVSALFSGNDSVSPVISKTLWSVRLPRIILALTAGAGLSAAGCSFQSLFSNPLATPDTVGAASGAAFGAVLAIVLGMDLIGIQLFSFAGGLLAVLLTSFSVTGRNKNMNTMILAGIMIGSLFNALISLLKFTADQESKLPAITYWLMGGLDKAGFRTLATGAPPVLIGLTVLWLLRWKMNYLPLSEDEAASSGVNIKALRITVIICAAMITASCVSMCGQVGWIGLLVPHMCRMLYGNGHTRLLPASLSFGASYMVIVDTLARSLFEMEIPVSIITAIMGAPFFIILMRRKDGWRL